MKVKSKKYPNIVLETYEKECEFGKPLQLLAHNEIQRAIHLIPKEVNFDYDLDIQKLEDNHYISKCIMMDCNSKIVEFGESCENTLTSVIAKNYAALTATQRAFDRAAIRFFDFPILCYSDQEFLNISNENYVVHDNNGFFEEEIPELDSLSSELPDTDDVDENIALEDTIIEFTNYKGKTFKELIQDETAKNKLIWVAKNINSGKFIDNADKLRAYLEMQNIKYA